MADGHFPDVELLRRELAVLILEWAGKAVKEDPDGPMSTALTRAVGEAARVAVAEQHQILDAAAADRIAEALERRGGAGDAWRASPLALGLAAVAAAALLAVAFLLGLQVGRTDGELSAPAASATAASAAPIAPIAPSVDQAAADAPVPSKPRPSASPLAARPEPADARAARSVSRSPPGELGRPAPANGEASPRPAQPVGAATPAATSASSTTTATTATTP